MVYCVKCFSVADPGEILRMRIGPACDNEGMVHHVSYFYYRQFGEEKPQRAALDDELNLCGERHGKGALEGVLFRA